MRALQSATFVVETPDSDSPSVLRGISALLIFVVVVWLADIVTFDQMNKVWDEWIAPGPAPARATVEARIANPQWRVEIACVAAIG